MHLVLLFHSAAVWSKLKRKSGTYHKTSFGCPCKSSLNSRARPQTDENNHQKPPPRCHRQTSGPQMRGWEKMMLWLLW